MSKMSFKNEFVPEVVKKDDRLLEASCSLLSLRGNVERSRRRVIRSIKLAKLNKDKSF